MAGPAVYTIPPGTPFVDALADGLLGDCGETPLALAEVTVLLPTRRACRALREAFLRRTGGQPLLLPRMRPLGDLDTDDLGFQPDESELGASVLDCPPPIGVLRRQLLLAQLIQKVPGLSATPGQAVRLAQDLGQLFDQVVTEGLSFDRLQGLVPEEYAGHWQITLKFLEILTVAWPALRDAEGVLDPAERRNRLLAAQAALWRTAPPTSPVIAAGSTGSIPATRALLVTVAGLPNGRVVLPGLDQALGADAWERIEEHHPQTNLKRLVEAIGIDRADVGVWPALLEPAAAPRAALLSEAMRPAETTERWRSVSVTREALEGLVRLDCSDAQEEAGTIALLLRDVLETPERTAMLVTPDRALARRVAAHLGRWGLLVDDSAGVPLIDTSVGSYLRLAATAIAEELAPVPLLALLKHPLASGGIVTGTFRHRVRVLERVLLRGPVLPPGIKGLREGLALTDDRRFDRQGDRETLAGVLDQLAAMFEPFASLLGGSAPLIQLLEAHVALAEALAASDGQSGTERLWRHDDGEAAAAFIAELHQAAGDFPEVTGRDYPTLLEALMAPVRVRPRYGRHPRLAILGPLEARLLSADRIVLGGLNEGVWPALPEADPWMSRPMRTQFGLPAPERQIGLAAHDFVQLSAAREVFLTRADRVDGAPTVPSRWLLRLETVLRAAGLEGVIERDRERWRAWYRFLDQPVEVCPRPAPEPCPPVPARPCRLSVTEIETWMRDPYAIYAKHVLGLRALDPIAADPGGAERGQFIHDALDRFVQAFPATLPEDALQRLLELGQSSFGAALASPLVWAFWWPRFERIADWFVALETERRTEARPLATEVKGSIEVEGPTSLFTLTCKADRIDRLADGTLGIIDYKTGLVPSLKEIELGFAPQLPLEAAIAIAGGFDGVAPGEVGSLSFWRLTGGNPPGEVRSAKGDPAAMAESAHTGLVALVHAFSDPATPYRSCPRPARAPRYSDYTHLARVQEWSAGGVSTE